MKVTTHRYALSMVRLPGPPVCYLFHGAEESSYYTEETGRGYDPRGATAGGVPTTPAW